MRSRNCAEFRQEERLEYEVMEGGRTTKILKQNG